jgi:hypothetical protein
MSVDTKAADAAANSGDVHELGEDPAAELERYRAQNEARAWERYRAASQKLSDTFADVSPSAEEATATHRWIVEELHLASPRRPDEAWDPGSTAAAMETVASLASEHIVDNQSATQIAQLHLHAMRILSRADHWSNLLWARAYHEGRPGWLAYAFKPAIESMRLMRAHADAVDKLDRRKRRRVKDAARDAAPEEQRVEEPTTVEDASAETIPKAA